jgi:hypothetical protein
VVVVVVVVEKPIGMQLLLTVPMVDYMVAVAVVVVVHGHQARIDPLEMEEKVDLDCY